MPRILSIWLPQLPLDRLTRHGDPRLAGPFAVIAEEKNAWRVTHANDAALKGGVVAGQALADARAICPDLLPEPSDPVREDLLLRALWRWADALSPRVSLDAPDAMQAQAAENASRPLLKVKLGGGPEDVTRIEAVRRGAPKARIIVDANEGWTREEYETLAPKFLDLGVEMVEQPFPAGDDAALAGITRALPVCADESCHDRASLPARAG